MSSLLSATRSPAHQFGGFYWNLRTHHLMKKVNCRGKLCQQCGYVKRWQTWKKTQRGWSLCPPGSFFQGVSRGWGRDHGRDVGCMSLSPRTRMFSNIREHTLGLRGVGRKDWVMLRFEGGQEQTRGPKAENPGLLSIQGQNSAPSSISSKEYEVRDVAPGHWGGCPRFRQAVCLESEHLWPAVHTLGESKWECLPPGCHSMPIGPWVGTTFRPEHRGMQGVGGRTRGSRCRAPAALSCHQPVGSGAGRKPLGSSNQKEGSWRRMQKHLSRNGRCVCACVCMHVCVCVCMHACVWVRRAVSVWDGGWTRTHVVFPRGLLTPHYFGRNIYPSGVWRDCESNVFIAHAHIHATYVYKHMHVCV